MHTCSQLVQDVADMTDGFKQSEVITHKEKPSHIHSDSQDQQNIQDKLKTWIDPLDPADHPNGLVNILTGRVVPDIVNAGKSVEIGRVQMNVYQQSWPSDFNDTLSKKVVITSVTRKAGRPNKGTVQDYVDNFVSYISTRTGQNDIHLVFDRCHDYSIKSGARQE